MSSKYSWRAQLLVAAHAMAGMRTVERRLSRPPTLEKRVSFHDVCAALAAMAE